MAVRLEEVHVCSISTSTRSANLAGLPQRRLLASRKLFGINVLRENGQRFVWETPTTHQLADETAAYCAGGAQAILAWAWHVFDPGSTSPYQNARLRQGLKTGVKECHAIWSRGTRRNGQAPR